MIASALLALALLRRPDTRQAAADDSSKVVVRPGAQAP
jgi:hypothetical protein